MIRSLHIAAAGLLFSTLALAQSSAGPYTLRKHAVADGSRDSNATGFRLRGTTGQSDAGVIQGGAYTVYGGFWSPARLTPGELIFHDGFEGDGAIFRNGFEGSG